MAILQGDIGKYWQVYEMMRVDEIWYVNRPFLLNSLPDGRQTLTICSKTNKDKKSIGMMTNILAIIANWLADPFGFTSEPNGYSNK